MQCCRWGSNPRPLCLESSTLPLSHCAPIRYSWLLVYLYVQHSTSRRLDGHKSFCLFTKTDFIGLSYFSGFLSGFKSLISHDYLSQSQSTTPCPGLTNHKKESHTREPRSQTFPNRWHQGCKKQTWKYGKNSEWVWSGNTTITNRRQPCGTAR